MKLSPFDVGPTTSFIEGVSVMVPVFVCLTAGAFRNPGLNVGIFALPYDPGVSPVIFSEEWSVCVSSVANSRS